jgi:hypothetical protein
MLVESCLPEDIAMLGSDKAIIGAIAILVLGIVVSVLIG